MACGCKCSCSKGSALDWFAVAPEVSKTRITLSSRYLAAHSSCCGGCLLLAGGRYRCGAFSPDAVKNQKPHCPYGYGPN